MVMYLRPDEVRQLAVDFRREEIAWWVVDIVSVVIAERLGRSGDSLMKNAPFFSRLPQPNPRKPGTVIPWSIVLRPTTHPPSGLKKP
ncbi:hypothetical protein [Nocardia sp. NPDC059228]|uniref:hypothetical protein n=1 Tax=Nocardia sp. NPDC059228 TaxID=3346777 RepID=UPI0036994A11